MPSSKTGQLFFHADINVMVRAKTHSCFCETAGALGGGWKCGGCGGDCGGVRAIGGGGGFGVRGNSHIKGHMEIT